LFPLILNIFLFLAPDSCAKSGRVQFGATRHELSDKSPKRNATPVEYKMSVEVMDEEY